MTITAPVALLERMDTSQISFDPVQDTASDDRQLAQDAHQLLGYDTMNRKVIRAAANGKPLLLILQTLGIIPFTDGSVATYKKSVNQQFVFESRFERLYKAAWGIMFGGLATLIVGGFVGLTAGAPWGWLFVVGAVFALAGFIIMVTTADSHARMDLSWIKTSFDKYKDELPTAVLRTAVGIKAAFPSAVIEVEEMQLARVPRPVYDPFLVVSYEDESYYVAVWGEPDFKAEPLL